jgi:uncharacterized protein (DUF3820 family)
MEWKEAADVVMPFGKYKGRDLDDIAGSDEGLRYIDWLVGEDWLSGRLREAVEAYLSDPAIQKDLECNHG